MGALDDHLSGEGKTLADNFCQGCGIPVAAIGCSMFGTGDGAP